MKKQILILAMVFFASMSVVWGQQVQQVVNYVGGTAVGVPTVNAVTCGATTGIAEEIEPIVGKAYDYTVTVTPGTGAIYHWYVTNSATFIDTTNHALNTTGADPGNGTGSYIMAVGTVANYNQLAGTVNTLRITWKSFVTTPVFLVIYATNSTNGCADNLQAWKITPRNGFTLDLANIASADGLIKAADFPTCVQSIQSAIWDASSTKIIMDYGINYLYWAVSARNFGDAWKPSVKLTLPTDYITTPTGNDRTVTLDWAYAVEAGAATNWHAMSPSSGVYTSTDYATSNAYAKKTVSATTVDGTQIVFRLKVTHNTQESIVDANITLAVDGEMFGFNGTALTSQGRDVAAAAWTGFTGTDTGDCGTADSYDNDHVQQIIKPRPTIVNASPAGAPGAFLPRN